MAGKQPRWVEMVHCEVLTRAGHGCVADMSPGGFTNTEGAPMLGRRVITSPLIHSLAQSAGHRAGAHRAPWPPAPSHCWGGDRSEEKGLNFLPSTPRPLRQTTPKQKAPWSHGLRSLSPEMAEYLPKSRAECQPHLRVPGQGGRPLQSRCS